ncbi:DNA-binding protein [Cytobacillus praedii]|uniref:DNA-binding protein n=1 Tax=Cytobacillus praedii TaxID=1742358 RepID=UPI003F7EFF77
MNEIDKYMTVTEAAHRWEVPVDTVQNYLKPSVPTTWAKTEKMIENGLLKYFQKPDGKRREWIISEQAMEIWFKKD